MGFLIQKLASSVQAISLYLIPFLRFISACISRLRMFSYSLKTNDRDEIFLEPEKEALRNATEGGEKTELHLKFKFPSFEEISRRGNTCNSESINKYEFAPGKSSVSAFIEVLATFPVKEIYGDKISSFSENDEVFPCRKFVKVDEKMIENALVDAIVSQDKKEKKVELVQEVEDFLDFCSEENSDGFLSDGEYGEESDINVGKENIRLKINESGGRYGDEESNDKKLEEYNSQNLVRLSSDLLREKEFNVNLDKRNDVGFVSGDDAEMNSGDNPKKSKGNEPSISYFGDTNKLESLWEHQELIEQLQMELRKVKATGLPTILEEPESPMIMDDLKPWKIDEKFQHENCMGELHKQYRSYTEMMRTYDILNYQKMYAMGFLQLKDPFQSISQQKPSAATLKSLLSQNIWLFKHRSQGSDPIKKFVNELEGDLEVVYVGQMSLSWEFLRWQYEKALDLWNSDPNGTHRYNEVAGEFQQFQVLVQRFTENERFQGPRVQSYVKSRCILRNLLQVPLIREDCLEEKSKGRRHERDEYAITSETLVDTVEESIRVFWQFVRSDKDCTAVSIKKMPDLNNPQDLKLLLDVRKALQKKEKQLKHALRSEKCILRKFRRRREGGGDEALHFFAQVDVKLVSRVVNMSKVSRDQLIWCQNKLNKISFVNRKLYIEPAFLLFPC